VRVTDLVSNRPLRTRRLPSRSVGVLLLCALAILLAAVAAAASPASAAPSTQIVVDPTISELRVQVMPEFDDPRVLAIIQGRLDIAADELPVTLTVPVPRGAQINQMAVMNTSAGAIESQPFDAVPDPEDEAWTLVTYEIDSAHFFYEYYYAPFTLANPDRRFTYTFATPYDVKGLQIEMQQPLAASDFTLSPPAVMATQDETLGFTYHLYEYEKLSAGSQAEITVAYRKTTDEPSVTREQLAGAGMPAGGVEETSPATQGPSSAIWGSLIGLAALGAVGAVVFLWLRSGRGPGEASPVRANVQAAGDRRSGDAKVFGAALKTGDDGSAIAEGATAFCTACGTRLRGDAHFCHNCGSRTE